MPDPSDLSHNDIGALGEEIAARHLSQQGYRLVTPNYRAGRNEIDLVCEDGPELVFIEVKTLSHTQHIAPEKAVTPAKQRRLLAAATHFLDENALHDTLCRFDVIAVGLDDPAHPRIVHLKDAFRG